MRETDLARPSLECRTVEGIAQLLQLTVDSIDASISPSTLNLVELTDEIQIQRQIINAEILLTSRGCGANFILTKGKVVVECLREDCPTGRTLANNR